MLSKITILSKLPELALKNASRNFHLCKTLNGEGVFEKVFGSHVEKPTKSHSVLLADQQILYELQIHNVKPDSAEEYEKVLNGYVPEFLNKNSDINLAGSWRSEIGALDQYVHLWRYKNYNQYSGVFERLRKDNNHLKFNSQVSKLISRRESQICLSFTYWGEPQARVEPHIYEMRTYSLKPGTLSEWGNNWSRGIRNRLDYRCAGMFTQVGPIYYVHHIWAYKDLADRKDSREKMWNKPGWDRCVAYTVPLIRKMESKVMTALPFSPTK